MKTTLTHSGALVMLAVLGGCASRQGPPGTPMPPVQALHDPGVFSGIGEEMPPCVTEYCVIAGTGKRLHARAHPVLIADLRLELEYLLRPQYVPDRRVIEQALLFHARQIDRQPRDIIFLPLQLPFGAVMVEDSGGTSVDDGVTSIAAHPDNMIAPGSERDAVRLVRDLMARLTKNAPGAGSLTSRKDGGVYRVTYVPRLRVEKWAANLDTGKLDALRWRTLDGYVSEHYIALQFHPYWVGMPQLAVAPGDFFHHEEDMYKHVQR